MGCGHSLRSVEKGAQCVLPLVDLPVLQALVGVKVVHVPRLNADLRLGHGLWRDEAAQVSVAVAVPERAGVTASAS